MNNILNFVLVSMYGIIATSFMSIFGLIAYRIWGLRGSLEFFESQRMYEILRKKEPRYNLTITGSIIHVINGWLLGLPFLLLVYFDLLSQDLIIFGILYGLVIWFMTLAPVHRLLTDDPIISNPLGFFPVIVSIIGHLVYGLVLSGLLVLRGFSNG